MLIIQEAARAKLTEAIERAKQNGSYEGGETPYELSKLKENIEYLEQYGHGPGVRVVMTSAAWDFDGFNLRFEWLHNGEWRADMVGGLVYHSTSNTWGIHS